MKGGKIVYINSRGEEVPKNSGEAVERFDTMSYKKLPLGGRRTRRRGGGILDMARKGINFAQEHDLDDTSETDPAAMMKQMGPMLNMMKQAGVQSSEGGRRTKKMRRRGKGKKSRRIPRKY